MPSMLNQLILILIIVELYIIQILRIGHHLRWISKFHQTLTQIGRNEGKMKIVLIIGIHLVDKCQKLVEVRGLKAANRTVKKQEQELLIQGFLSSMTTNVTVTGLFRHLKDHLDGLNLYMMLNLMMVIITKISIV